jgi:hypothetical protein
MARTDGRKRSSAEFYVYRACQTDEGEYVTGDISLGCPSEFAGG